MATNGLRKGAGRPGKTFRLSIDDGAREFRIDPKTLTSRLRSMSILPGADAHFSIYEIAQAVSGSLERERIRETASKADLNEIEKEKILGVLVDAGEVERMIIAWTTRMRTQVESSGIPEELQHLLLTALADIAKDSAT